MTDLQSAKMRGYICKAAFAWARETLGQERIDEIGAQHTELIEAMGLDMSRKGAGFLPSIWYSAEYVHVFTDAFFGAQESPERADMARRAGVYVFTEQLTGLQRALLSLMMSPKRYIKHASKAWLHNFNDGTLHFETGEEEDGRSWHRCTYTEWSAHHPVICQMMMQGKRVIYEAMGCKDVDIIVETCDPHGSGCSSTVSWLTK